MAPRRHVPRDARINDALDHRVRATAVESSLLLPGTAVLMRAGSARETLRATSPSPPFPELDRLKTRVQSHLSEDCNICDVRAGPRPSRLCSAPSTLRDCLSVRAQRHHRLCARVQGQGRYCLVRPAAQHSDLDPEAVVPAARVSDRRTQRAPSAACPCAIARRAGRPCSFAVACGEPLTCRPG